MAAQTIPKVLDPVLPETCDQDDSEIVLMFDAIGPSGDEEETQG